MLDEKEVVRAVVATMQGLRWTVDTYVPRQDLYQSITYNLLDGRTQVDRSRKQQLLEVS